MFVTKDKVLVHFNTNTFKAYVLENNILSLLCEKDLTNLEVSKNNMVCQIDSFLYDLEKQIGKLDIGRVRLYATGFFHDLTQSEKDDLTIHVFVCHGLCLNIIQPDLEQFYLERSLSICDSYNLMYGVVNQEFRKVVICGSFQQHLKEIGEVMELLQKQGVIVLSPWTTKVVPETMGTDFILLEGQEPLRNERDAWKHKYIHMDKFRQADAIIICNPNGRIGKGTWFEFGFMTALSKRIIFTEAPKDLSIPFPYEIGLNC